MKVAVVLFNLGGPSSLDAVQPFLFNLFYDPAILRVPNPLRWLLAKFLSKQRTAKAKEIYRHLGGKSPLVENTLAQRDALQERLHFKGIDAKVFVSMRYTPPFLHQIIPELEAFQADKIVLLPLYPQYSTTTTASSFKEWDKLVTPLGLKGDVIKLCCYPTGEGFIDAQVEIILKEMKGLEDFRLLFSAHGLPTKIVNSGDPYVFHVEQTAKKLAESLSHKLEEPVDFQVCYQSRVGPIEWVGPSTEKEIERCAKDKKNILLVPLSFVSEHSETLFELDIEYKNLADSLCIEHYCRVSTVGTHPSFVNFLVDTVSKMIEHSGIVCSEANTRICPKSLKGCPCSYNQS